MKFWLIARKELAHALNVQVAYVVVLIFWVSLPIPVFWVPSGMNVFLNGQADLTPFFRVLPLFLVVFAPALTMRAWAEERASGAMELLMTAPVRTRDLVLGKFLGYFLLLVFCLIGTLPLPFLVDWLGPLDWGPVIGGYCGAVLLAACCVAFTLCFGSLTRHQANAFVFGFVGLGVLMFFMPPALNPNTRFLNVARGVLDSRDLGFYAAATALALLVNMRLLEVRR